MKRIKKYDEIMKNKEMQKMSCEDLGINGCLYRAYASSIEYGNENYNGMLNFYDISVSNVKEVAKVLRKEKIDRFTISESSSGLMDILSAFNNENIVIVGMSNAQSCYYDFDTGSYRVISAIELEVK